MTGLRRIRGTVISVDYDDTLALSNQALVEWHNDMYGTSHRVGPDSYILSELWGVHYHEVEKRFHEFVDSLHHDKVDPLPGSIQVLRKLCELNDIHMVTGRTPQTEQRTRIWMNATAAGIFTDLHFVGKTVDHPSPRVVKSAVLRKIEAAVHIEDSPHMAKEVAENAPETTVLLLDTVWNQDFEHPLVKRVKSWQHIGDLLI